MPLRPKEACRYDIASPASVNCNSVARRFIISRPVDVDKKGLETPSFPMIFKTFCPLGRVWLQTCVPVCGSRR